MGATVTKRSLAEMCEAFLSTRAEAQKLYKQADEMLDEIAEEMDPGDEVNFRGPKGQRQKYVMLDNFAGQSKVWAHGSVRHYDIEILDA